MLDDFYCDEALSGRTPVRVVQETDTVLAFHHTRPHWAAHIVVVPKRHIPSLAEIGPDDEPLLIELLRVVRDVSRLVETEQGGAHVVTNLGKYQESKHLHFHVGGGEIRDRPGTQRG